jgi:pyridoxal/pyridoxine/pyridoxamine kinase
VKIQKASSMFPWVELHSTYWLTSNTKVSQGSLHMNAIIPALRNMDILSANANTVVCSNEIKLQHWYNHATEHHIPV